MWRSIVAITLGVALAGALAHTVLAQSGPAPGTGRQHDHGSPAGHGAAMHAQHMQAMGGTIGEPTQPGQAAFGAIAEIVKILDTDPATDWSKVDLERLRQHLIDMDEVVLRSAVKQAPVSGGLAMEITGTGRTEQAIHAMVVPHAAELDRMPGLSAKTEPARGGVRLTVTARDAQDARAVARLRGLGFIGLLTLGAHHQPHHLTMARGGTMPGHGH